MELNRRLLIVDDQNDLRDQMAQVLLNSGRPNKTSRLVRGMRARLMGIAEEPETDNELTPNYDIDTAGQGEEAYDMVKAAIENNAPYAVMFVDMRMPPGWDGLKTAQKIRQLDSKIEIVIMTAYADHSQEDLTREIGKPEKLLYIKKPFQSEEICQLALSLCAKWNSQALEQIRRQQLDKLIMNLRKIKQQENLKDTYEQILESYLGFFETTKGFIASWIPDGQLWQIHAIREYDQNNANEFLINQQAHILETNALSEIDHLQVVPLRERGCNCFIFAANSTTSNDTVWFQSINVMNQASLDQIEFGKKLALRLQNCPSNAQLDDVKEIVEILRKKYLGDPDIAKLSARLNDISY